MAQNIFLQIVSTFLLISEHWECNVYSQADIPFSVKDIKLEGWKNKHWCIQVRLPEISGETCSWFVLKIAWLRTCKQQGPKCIYLKTQGKFVKFIMIIVQSSMAVLENNDATIWVSFWS